MRLSSLTFFLLVCVFSVSLMAQHPAQWEYMDGQLDTGYVFGVNARLKSEHKIRLFHSNEQLSFGAPKIPVDYQPVSYLIRQGDTLLVRRLVEGKQRLLVKLSKGYVQLFREVRSHRDGLYFALHNNQFYPVRSLAANEGLLDQLFPERENLPLPKKINSDVRARKFVRLLNYQLTQNTKKWQRRYAIQRNRLGVAYNTYSPLQYYFRGYFNRIFSAGRVPHTVQLPTRTVFYERQLHKGLKGLFGDVQFRAFRRKESNQWRYVPETSNPPLSILPFIPENANETFSIFNLYVYPGLLLELQGRSRLVPFLGAGGAAVLPLYFKRILNIENVALTPTKQTIRRGQAFSIGYYATLGFRIKLLSPLMIGVAARFESLPQWWEPQNDSIIYSKIFQPDNRLAEEKQLQLQCQLLYSW